MPAEPEDLAEVRRARPNPVLSLRATTPHSAKIERLRHLEDAFSGVAGAGAADDRAKRIAGARGGVMLPDEFAA